MIRKEIFETKSAEANAEGYRVRYSVGEAQITYELILPDGSTALTGATVAAEEDFVKEKRKHMKRLNAQYGKRAYSWRASGNMGIK